jgi:hypothetical protein
MDAFGNYRISPSRTQDDNQFGIRTDHVLSTNDTVHVSFAYSNSDAFRPGLFSISAGASPLDIRTVGLGWTHIFAPNLVNIFRAGYSDFNQFGIGPVGDADPAALGIKNVVEIPKGCIAYPGISIGQSSGLSSNAGNCFGGHDRDLLLYDDLTWVRGKHTFSFGADIRRASHLVFDQLFLDGYLGFYAGFSGNNTADFVLGAPFFGFFGLGSSAATNNGWWMSYYVNDNYRVTPKLTLNLGLRYMNNAPLVPKEHNYGAFDFSTATLLHPPEGGVPPGVANRANTNFAPRVGFAYQVGEKTMIRSAYGVYFVDDPGDDLSFNALNPPTYGQVFEFGYFPGALTYTVNEGLPSDILPPASILATVDPTGTPDGSVSLYTRERNRHSPYMQVWNFSIQRTLPWQMLLDITYGGNKGTHLSKRVDMNTAVPLTGPPCDPITPVPGCDPLTLQERRPYTRWGSIFQSTNRANSSYHALQVKMQKDLSQGLNFLLAYTWSKAISEDDYDALASRNYSWTRLSADRGPATYDRRHRFSSSLTYALPFGRNATGLTRQLGGWNVSLINSFTSGAPFSVTTSSDYAQIGNSVGYPRPDRICNGNLPKDERTVQRWFDTNCFVAPVSPFPHLGNAGFNFLESHGLIQSDISVQKEFSFEPLKVQFRGDFFNAFNVVNFGAPGNDLDGEGYGVITRALDPRRIQLMLKVTW